ncbi:MAG: ABC transporter permease [Acidimicrobiales bacterium]
MTSTAAVHAPRSHRNRLWGAVRAFRARLVSVVITLICASVIVFSMLQLVPGDPAQIVAGEDASVERVEEVREELGLNDPLPVQYLSWVGGVVRGDLGESVITGEPVSDAIRRTFPRTFQVVMAGLFLAVLMGIPLGIAAALRANTMTDSTIRMVSTAGLAVPNFWLGLIMISVFALGLGWLPATGFVSITENVGDSLRHLALPAITIGLTAMAAITRQTRSALIEVLDADFIRTLRAMGIRGRLIIWRHALKNASIPVVTIIGLDINRAIGGTVVIESVFGIAGIGGLVVNATTQRDFPMVQGVILVVVFMVVLTNLIVDFLYTLLDPRISLK